MKFTQKAVRRWFAAALALLLTFTLALPAMAATAEAEEFKITIKNNKGLPAMTDKQFKAYQIFTGTPNKETEKNPGGTEGLNGWKKPNDWQGTNWDNYTLADIKWGKDVKKEELVRALITLSGETDIEKWPEFFTSKEEGGANKFTEIAKFKEPTPQQQFDDGVVDAAAQKLAYLLERNNNNAFLQAFSKFIVEGKDGKNGFLQDNAGVESKLKEGEPDDDASNDESIIDLTKEGAGYYLIADTGTHTGPEKKDDATSEYILAVLASQTIQLKASIPTVDKNIVKPSDDTPETLTDVKGDAAGISDTVFFKLTGTLPENFLDYDTYFYEFTDTLSKGLEFKNIDIVTVTLPTGTEGDSTTYTIYLVDEATTSGDASGYTVTKPEKAEEPAEDGSKTFKVTFPDLMQLMGTKQPTEEAAPDTKIPWDAVSFKDMPKVKIEVVYEATVTGDAVIGSEGNPNDVYLTYSNDPNSDEHGQTHDVKVYVYAFGLDLTKKASDTMNGLGGASFVLTKKGVDEDGNEVTLYAKFADAEDDGVSETTPKPKKLVSWDNESTYKSATAEGAESKSNEYYLTSEAGTGKLPNVLGLDEGTYTLTEVVTPAGYNTMDPFTFTIKAEFNPTGQLTKVTYTHDGKSKEYSSTDSEPTNGVFKSGLLPDDLINQKAPFLPFTGGMGSTLIYLAGALLIAGAAVTVAVVVRKRSKTHA